VHPSKTTIHISLQHQNLREKTVIYKKKRGDVKEGEKLPTQKSLKKAIGSFAM
jgi:hypothetical protein